MLAIKWEELYGIYPFNSHLKFLHNNLLDHPIHVVERKIIVSRKSKACFHNSF